MLRFLFKATLQDVLARPGVSFACLVLPQMAVWIGLALGSRILVLQSGGLGDGFGSWLLLTGTALGIFLLAFGGCLAPHILWPRVVIARQPEARPLPPLRPRMVLDWVRAYTLVSLYVYCGMFVLLLTLTFFADWAGMSGMRWTAADAPVLVLILLLPALAGGLRRALVLPMCAAGRAFRFSQAVEATQGHFLLFLACAAVMLAPLLVLRVLLGLDVGVILPLACLGAWIALATALLTRLSLHFLEPASRSSPAPES